MKKTVYFFLCVFLVTSCRKDKVPTNNPSLIENILPTHAPIDFELIATVPVSPNNLDNLNISPTGEMIWSLDNIWRSSDMGVTWSEVNNPSGSKTTEILSDNTFFAGWWNLYRTTDNGSNYTQVLPGMTYDVEHVYGNTVFAAGLKIKKSDDLGQTWNDVYNQGEDSMSIVDLQFKNNTIGYAVGFPDLNTTHDILVLKTSNGGSSWKPSLIVPDEYCNNAHFVTSEIGYALTTNANYLQKIYRTNDGGESWIAKPDITIPSARIIHFYNETEGYLVASGKLYRTKDSGSTWTQIFVSWDDVNDPLTCINTYNGKVFLAFANGKLYRSK